MGGLDILKNFSTYFLLQIGGGALPPQPVVPAFLMPSKVFIIFIYYRFFMEHIQSTLGSQFSCVPLEAVFD